MDAEWADPRKASRIDPLNPADRNSPEEPTGPNDRSSPEGPIDLKGLPTDLLPRVEPNVPQGPSGQRQEQSVRQGPIGRHLEPRAPLDPHRELSAQQPQGLSARHGRNPQGRSRSLGNNRLDLSHNRASRPRQDLSHNPESRLRLNRKLHGRSHSRNNSRQNRSHEGANHSTVDRNYELWGRDKSIIRRAS